MFYIVGLVMRVAPIAAFGAMAFTVGKYGFGSILSLAKLMGTMYVTCAINWSVKGQRRIGRLGDEDGRHRVVAKGSAGVTGSGFITLAATLASLGKWPNRHRASTRSRR